eukprot:s5386_g2.t1
MAHHGALALAVPEELLLFQPGVPLEDEALDTETQVQRLLAMASRHVLLRRGDALLVPSGWRIAWRTLTASITLRQKIKSRSNVLQASRCRARGRGVAPRCTAQCQRQVSGPQALLTWASRVRITAVD